MIITIAGVLNESGGTDLSGYLDRSAEFRVEASQGKRMDTLNMTLFDKNAALVIPDRAEIIIYDLPGQAGAWAGGAPVVDPPAANSTPLAYQYDSDAYYDEPNIVSSSAVWVVPNGSAPPAKYDTMPPIQAAANPVNWSPRLFGGYVATAEYSVTAAGEREIHITAQDYTVRNKTTIVNKAFGPDALHPAGWSDQQIISDLYLRYRSDIDVTFVNTTVAAGVMPAISFPTHTLEQMMERVLKISSAWYRIDYYGRLYYGLVGSQSAPFNISDAPNNVSTFGAENVRYSKDGANLVDRIWVVGGTFQGPSQSYTLSPSPNGVAYAFPLPDRLQNAATVTVTVNGVDQGAVGTIGVDGTLDGPANFSKNVLISQQPPVIAFKTPPANGATVVITGIFVYPLIRIVTDDAKAAAVGGLIFEKKIVDKRIDTSAMAGQVATAHLAAQGSAKPQGSCILKQRGIGGSLLQPGQSINITNHALFANGVLSGGGTTLAAIVTRMVTTLTDDTSQPYDVEMEFSDRPDLTDDDLFDHILGEQGRVNAALEQSDINAIVQDAQTLAETLGFQVETTTTTLLGTTYTPGTTTPTYTYDNAGSFWGFGTYS